MPDHSRRYLVSLGLVVTALACPGASLPALAAPAVPEPSADRYTPIPGGWQIRLGKTSDYPDMNQRRQAAQKGPPSFGIDPDTGRLTPDAPIGLLLDNPRAHRRPLFPPADKSLIWTDDQQARTPRVTFRPLILAYNAPRFLFDYHSAGGLLGHLFLGLVRPGGGDKWFHEWSRIDVRYVDGRLEYTLRDEAFGDTYVRLTAAALADAAGLIVSVEISDAGQDASLVWAYGGASGFFTNWNVVAPEFSFSPPQCAKDRYVLQDGTFELVRAFDQSDKIVAGEGASLSVMRFLPEWKARIRIGSSWPGTSGFGDPKAFLERPGGLLAATTCPADQGAQTGTNCVAVQKVTLSDGRARGYVVVGMGGNIADAIRDPEQAFRAALARNESIARRVVTRTPDPHLDAAVTMIGFATEGTWASQAYVHGGWSWRFAYLGWRILYGPTCYGWTDRVRKSIQNHCRLGRIADGPDQGGLSSMLESTGLFYNMNEVFFDMVRHYYQYTDDLELMKEVFPVLEGVLERQNRRLQPERQDLYENALNTWISDSHWYIRGQCTQSSAYILRAYEFMADLAPRLNKDPAPFREHAGRVRDALNRVLWQKRLGVFAEYRDTRGQRLLHGEPELPTIYHSAEFGAADPLQVYQMLHWADTHLKQERTPGGGLLYWSSNWFPNHGRSYTHSTYELAYAEELNFAETNYLAGRSEIGYAVLRAALSGVFNGPTPGGLSCHAFIDGTQRANDEFADASSLFGRAVCEGLFGIKLDRPRRTVKLTPQLPPDWPEASIRTPHFSYRFQRTQGLVRIDWESPVVTSVALSLPIQASAVRHLKVDGTEARYDFRKGIGLTWLTASTPESDKGTIEVSYAPASIKIPDTIRVRQDQPVTLSVPGLQIAELADLQGLLTDASIRDGQLIGKAQADAGPGVLFLSQAGSQCPRWTPIALSIEPQTPDQPRAWSAPHLPDRDLSRWVLIDLASVYNAKVPEVPKRVNDAAIPPEMPADQVGFNYWKDHLVGRSSPPCDQAWRAKVGPDGVAWTTDGIPFKTTREGDNIGAVCLHNKAFPSHLAFPVRAGGGTLYLMISGMTHPSQSHVVNLSITLHYADGTDQTHDLVNPFDLADCWSTWCGLYFDTPANGFENLGGRQGPAGTRDVPDRARPVAVDTIAHLVAMPLRPGAELQSLKMQAIANDVVFGIMGASILK